MSMMTKLLTAGALAASLSVGTAQAVTFIDDGDTEAISGGDTFFGIVYDADGDGSDGTWTIKFNSVIDPLMAEAIATINGPLIALYKDLVVSWVGADGTSVLTSTPVTGATSLSTTFTVPNMSQFLRFSWSSSPVTGERPASGGFDVTISAVPVPAAGFLLVGALGGLVALRRRKTA